MADIALTDENALTARAHTTRRAGAGNARFHFFTWLAALAVLLIFAGVITSLVIGAMPAIKAFGFGFLTTEVWSPARDKFGALASIYGTLITSFLAMLVAVPVGIGVAIFLTELCPRVLRRPIGIAIELLAGIPSIIYGIWGLFVFAPWFQEHVQLPVIDATVTGIPVIGTLFGGSPYGIGVITASLILSIMILPFISAVTRDVFETVPDAQGSRLRSWLHHLGSDVAGSLALRPLRRGRRRHAGAGPGAGRNHGGHLRDRQCPQDRFLAVRAGHHHLGHHRQ